MITRRQIRRFSLLGLCLLACLSKLSAEEAALPSIMDLQRSYVQANGGLANIQELSSLIANGHVGDAEGKRYDFKLYRKRPNMMRTQVDFPKGSNMTVFDGSQAFQVVSARGEPDRILELTGEEAARMEADSALDGPFFQLRGRPEWLEVVAEVTVDGQAAYEIVIDAQAKSPYQRLWISKEHHQEVKLSRMVTTQAGDEVREEIYFGDFEQVRGVWLARNIRYERGGELTQTVAIGRVRANVGIFDSFFAKPKY